MPYYDPQVFVLQVASKHTWPPDISNHCYIIGDEGGSLYNLNFITFQYAWSWSGMCYMCHQHAIFVVSHCHLIKPFVDQICLNIFPYNFFSQKERISLINHYTIKNIIWYFILDFFTFCSYQFTTNHKHHHHMWYKIFRILQCRLPTTCGIGCQPKVIIAAD